MSAGNLISCHCPRSWQKPWAGAACPMAVQRGVWLTRLMNAIIAELWMIELKLIWVSASTRCHSVDVRFNWIISLLPVRLPATPSSECAQFIGHAKLFATPSIYSCSCLDFIHFSIFETISSQRTHAVGWKIISINCNKACAHATPAPLSPPCAWTYQCFNEFEIISICALNQSSKIFP